MMKLVRLAAVVVTMGFFATGAWAAGVERGVAGVVESNNKKLTVPWLTIKPGQPESSGFVLDRNGSLSHAGIPLHPQLEVSGSDGKSSNNPSEVKISAISPSGNFALLTACEPIDSPDNLCWFQYLVDLKNGKLHKASWAKYPVPIHVWWAQDDSFAVIPISAEGEVWLSLLDLKKIESQDIHFYDSTLAALRPQQCKPSEEEVVIDLDTLHWLNNNEITISVTAMCGRPLPAQVLTSTVKLDSGAVKATLADVPQEFPAKQAVASGPSFDCSKASSAVEKIICADANLAKLDRALVAAYRQSMGQAGNRDEIKSQQLNWLRQVRNQCTAAPCLTAAYQQRINALQQMSGTSGEGEPSPFPATYQGGFTGDEKLTFTSDGQVLDEEGAASGSYLVDHESPWSEAKYPIVITQTVNGETLKRPCKITTDMRKMLCMEGGSMASEFDRVDPAPAVKLAPAKKCDDEQLYLEVMDAARKARPDWELKGSTDILLDANGKCTISLYYLNNGEAIDLPATYDLTVRPVKLILTSKPSPPARVTCSEVKYGSDSYHQKMEELAKLARLPDDYYNRYHEDAVSDLCKGNTKAVKDLIDNGYVKKSEVEAIREVLGIDNRTHRTDSGGNL